MTVTHVGPTCERCWLPAWKDGLCSGCWRLRHMLGHDAPVSYARTGLEALAIAGVAHLSADFDRELQEWIADA